MRFQVNASVRRLLKTTGFWQDNQIILREFKYFPTIAILSLVFSLLAAVFEGFGLSFLLAFLQNLTNPHARPIHTGVQWFDVQILGVNTSATSRLYRVSGLILLTTWLRAVFNYLTILYIELTQLHLVDRLRKRIFEQLQALNLSYFMKTHSGELVNSIIGEVGNIKQVFNAAAYAIVRGLTIAVYGVSLVLLSWQLTTISLLLFSLLAVGLSRLNRQVREASFAVSTANGKFASVAIEFINGIRTVQAFATQDFERKRFYHTSSELVGASTKALSSMSLIRPLGEGIATTILVSMIIAAFGGFLTQGAMQAASLLTFLFILFRLVPIIQDLNGIIAVFSSLQGSTANIKQLLRTDDKPYFQNGHIKFSGLKQSIDLVSVDFGYNSSNLVLQNITLTIRCGQMTALVGASGAGKTTLADLIPRFYDPTAGNVLIDGVNLREFEIKSVRQKMAVVSQDTFIFNTNVRNNIAYGIEGADEAAIQEAARQANALEFIQEMPEGFETQLGDRGVRLSGGQRQRIAIARALLRNPDILILDEATSALDSVSERLIQESLEKLSIGRTVIAIAHRLSTIVRADKVVVLDRGRIVEQGGYQELLEQRGKLWKYHQMQHEISQAS